MEKQAAARRVKVRRADARVFAEPINVLVAAGREVFEVGFLDRVAFGFTRKAVQKRRSALPFYHP